MVQPLAHSLVSCRKCNIMFRSVIVILLAPLTKKHFRHNSDFTFFFFFCIAWCVCITQRVGIGVWGNQYLKAEADGQKSWGRVFWESQNCVFSVWTPVCLWCPLITEGQCHTGRSLGLPWKGPKLNSHGQRIKKERKSLGISIRWHGFHLPTSLWSESFSWIINHGRKRCWDPSSDCFLL